MKPGLLLLGVPLLYAAAAPTEAAVYKCKMASGSVVYTDQPCAPAKGQTSVDVKLNTPQGVVPQPVVVSPPTPAKAPPSPAAQQTATGVPPGSGPVSSKEAPASKPSGY